MWTFIRKTSNRVSLEQVNTHGDEQLHKLLNQSTVLYKPFHCQYQLNFSSEIYFYNSLWQVLCQIRQHANMNSLTKASWCWELSPHVSMHTYM